ncbi:MAG: hypothetical protein ACNA8K_00870 [Cyclonatronaceae bacterium]
MNRFALIFLVAIMLPASLLARQGEPLAELRINGKTVSPAGAMIRSFVLPGWGQLSLGSEFNRRGALHLGAEATLITSYLWLHFNAESLENNMYAHVKRYAGVDISNRSRSFQLAVAAHSSLYAYNDFQERARQWNEILDEVAQNQWLWASEQNRFDYQDIRNRVDRNRQQLPAIATLMVANRIISGVHAFMSARRMASSLPEVSLSMPYYGEPAGVMATLSFCF